jgi:hypothetical protein
MLSGKIDKLLSNLVKIDRGIARIYEYLSKLETFTPPCKTVLGEY